jgi:hypothetical protein
MGNGHVYWLATVLTVLGGYISCTWSPSSSSASSIPSPTSNVTLLVGHDPDPIKVCEAAVRVLALAQTPARMPRGTRLTLDSR